MFSLYLYHSKNCGIKQSNTLPSWLHVTVCSYTDAKSLLTTLIVTFYQPVTLWRAQEQRSNCPVDFSSRDLNQLCHDWAAKLYSLELWQRTPNANEMQQSRVMTAAAMSRCKLPVASSQGWPMCTATSLSLTSSWPRANGMLQYKETWSTLQRNVLDCWIRKTAVSCSICASTKMVGHEVVMCVQQNPI